MAWITGGQSEYLGTASQQNNAKIIYDYFNSKGWTLNAIAGLCGNIQQESTFNPNLIEIGGTGHGLVQWTPASNLYDVLDVLYGTHTAWYDGDKQLTALYAEYEQATGLKNYGIEKQWYSTSSYPMSWKEWSESTEDSGTLALAFQANYERPASLHSERADYARTWYSYLSGLTPNEPSTDIVLPSFTPTNTIISRDWDYTIDSNQTIDEIDKSITNAKALVEYLLQNNFTFNAAISVVSCAYIDSYITLGETIYQDSDTIGFLSWNKELFDKNLEKMEENQSWNIQSQAQVYCEMLLYHMNNKIYWDITKHDSYVNNYIDNTTLYNTSAYTMTTGQFKKTLWYNRIASLTFWYNYYIQNGLYGNSYDIIASKIYEKFYVKLIDDFKTDSFIYYNSTDESDFLEEQQSNFNAKIIYNYFNDKDWSFNSIIALLVNMEIFSQINPNYSYNEDILQIYNYGLLCFKSEKLISTIKLLHKNDLNTSLGTNQLDVIDYETKNEDGNWSVSSEYSLTFSDFIKSNDNAKYLFYTFYNNYQNFAIKGEIRFSDELVDELITRFTNLLKKKKGLKVWQMIRYHL